jgi:predicted deacetylase
MGKMLFAQDVTMAEYHKNNKENLLIIPPFKDKQNIQ